MASGFQPSGFPHQRHQSLHTIESTHFWFAARDRLVKLLLQRHSPSRLTQRLIDLGCGTGRFLATLGDSPYQGVGIDGHLRPLTIAAQRLSQSVWVHADICHLPLADQQFDIAVALDVLEHVEPQSFLDEAARILRPGGHLLVSVPALPWLWSRLDEQAHHRCRYTVRQLRQELSEAGFELEAWTHYQLFLLPLLVLSRLSARQQERAFERHPPRWLNQVLAWVNSMEVSVLHRWQLPIGSSLIAWGRRLT